MTKLHLGGGTGCIEPYDPEGYFDGQGLFILDGKTGLLIKWPYFIEGVGG